MPNLNFNSEDSFTFRVNDGIEDSANTETFTITVTAVNDAPTGKSFSFSMGQDTTAVIDLITLSDPSDDETGGPIRAQIERPLNPNLGTLRYSTDGVNFTPLGTSEPYSTNTVTHVEYTPEPGQSGEPYTEFRFSLNDGDETSSPPFYVVTIDVSEQNTQPIANSTSVTATEDQQTMIELTGSDDGGLDALTADITIGPSLSGAKLLQLDQTEISGGTGPVTLLRTVLYVPPPNVNSGTDTFSFTLTDADPTNPLTSDPATITINIEGSNDPPVVLSGSQTVPEGFSFIYTIIANDLTDARRAPNALFGIVVDYDASTGIVVTDPDDSDATAAPLPYLLTGLDFRVQLSPDFVGDTFITFRVVDDGTPPLYSNYGQLALTVSNENDAPTQVDISVSTLEDNNLLIKLLGSDVDTGETSTLRYRFPTVPDPSTEGSIFTTNDLVTTATQINAGGQTGSGGLGGISNYVIFVPVANVSDYTASFSYLAVDINNVPAVSASTIGVTVTPVSDPPIAYGGAYELLENTDTVLTLTGNDWDDPNSSLEAYVTHFLEGPGGETVNVGNLYQYNGTAGDEITGITGTDRVLVTDAQRRVLFVPTPNTDQEGVEAYASMRFVLSDSVTDSNEALVQFFVEGINNPPVVFNDTDCTPFSPDNPPPNPTVNCTRDPRWEEDKDNLWIAPDRLAIDADGPNPAVLEIVSLPSRGRLYKTQGTTLIRGAQISLGDQVPSNIIYVTDPEDGDYIDSFSYITDDGELKSNETGFVQFYVYSVNDPPTTVNSTETVVRRRFRQVNLTAKGDVQDKDSEFLTYWIAQTPERGELYDVNRNQLISPRVRNDTDNWYELSSPLVRYVPSDEDENPSPFAEFWWYAFDGESFSRPTKVSIDRVKNLPPTAENVEVTGFEDEYTVVLLNGTDPENDQLRGVILSQPLRGSLYQYTSSGGVGTAIACDTCNFTETTLTSPGRRRLWFLPAPDEASDSTTIYAQFTFQLLDSEDLPSSIATVTMFIEPVEDAPIATNVTVTVREEDDKSVAVEGTDPEGDDLVFQILSTPTRGQIYQTLNGNDPINDPIEVTEESGPVEVINENQNVIYISPRVDAADPITDAFSFNILAPNTSEPISNTAWVSLTILPVNDQPIAQDLRYTVLEDSNVTIFLKGTDRDLVDQDSLEAIISSLPPKGVLFQYNENENGEVCKGLQVNGCDLDRIVTPFTDVTDNDLYRVIYFPPEDGAGDDFTRFSYFFTDQQTDSLDAFVVIDVTPVNDPPEATLLSSNNLRGDAGSDLVVELGGTDVDNPEDLRAIIVDPRSQSILASGSRLYRIAETPFKRDHLNFTARVTRGAEITENYTLLEDPLRRVIIDMQSVEPRTTISWNVIFTDGLQNSSSAVINVVVSQPEGVLPSGYDKDWPQWVALLLGIVAAVIGLLLAGVMVWRRNREKDDADGYMDLPFINEVTTQSSDGSEAMDGDTKEIKPRGPLEQLILDPKFQVMNALLEAIDVTEYDQLAKAIVNIFEYHELTLVMLKHFITLEVQNAASAGTLFRANSIASKMMTAYSKMIGLSYLTGTLRMPIDTVTNMKDPLEVDPRKLKGAKPQTQMLDKTCQNFVDWIITSAANAPPQFRELSHHLFFEVGKRFPASKHTAIGGFLFLRFFCPAIISPEGFGVVSSPPSPIARRSLVLIAKALQNLANGVTFGNKEAYMVPLNDFINRNTEPIQTFFDSMVRLPQKGAGVGVSKEIPPETLANSLNTIHAYLWDNQDSVVDVLEGRGGDTASQRTDTSQTSLRSSRHSSAGSLIARSLGDNSATDHDHTEIGSSDDDFHTTGGASSGSDQDMDDGFAVASTSAAAAAASSSTAVDESFGDDSGVQIIYGEDGEQYVIAGDELSDDDEVLYDDDDLGQQYSLEELGTETARAMGLEVDDWTALSDLDVSVDWGSDDDQQRPHGIAKDGSIDDPVGALRAVLEDLGEPS
mmetsp:Transcript_2259/g.3229  ORF Transcript_2259/g.3229 Transcript_2259/m.3229 type:complete len:1961 (-) Transcript_2259:97-5979(-)